MRKGKTLQYHEVRYIERLCSCCVLRMSILRPEPSINEDGWVDFQIISNSSTHWHSMWRNRIRNAWRVLHGTYNWSGFTLDTPAEAIALRDGIDEAVREAFPSIVSELEYERGREP